MNVYHPGNSPDDVRGRAECLAHVDAFVTKRKLEAQSSQLASLKRDQKAALKRAADQARKAAAKAAAAAVQRIQTEALKRQERSARTQAKKPVAAPKPRRHVHRHPVRRVRVPARVPFQVVERPGRYAAATTPEGMLHYIQIKALRLGAKHWFRDDVKFRVVIVKNGIPLAVSYPGGNFQEFYADLSGDGKRPDRRPHKGVNPVYTDEVFVTFKPGDRIRIVFLRQTVHAVPVPGVGLQPVWGYPVRVDLTVPSKAGRWMKAAFSGYSSDR